MSFVLEKLLRENIKKLKPYTSARDEYKGKEGVFLDANENSLGSTTHALFNRYPDPLQWEVKQLLSKVKNISPENILLGNGSDEPIDLIFRCFCNPGLDNVLIMPPTYGMYEVSANINDIETIKVPLTSDFEIDTASVLNAVNKHTKVIFICSPNNPTANLLSQTQITKLLTEFSGIVVLDEAYIDFVPENTLLPKLNTYPNLIILQTFSKAWGLANLRLGMAFASKEIIQYFNKVKPPYNISGLTQKLALEALQNEYKKNEYVNKILEQRKYLQNALTNLPFVLKIYPSHANFLLVKTTDGKRIYDFLVEKKVIVRDRSSVQLCEGCLRITVGTPEENKILLNTMLTYPT